MITTAPLPTPTDPAGRRVRLGRGAVHIVSEGEGPAVFFTHGIPGSVRDWRYLGPALAAKGFRAVRIDMPGFAQSDLDAWPELEPENRAPFFAALADALDVDQFILAGHSFGGGLALMTSALLPERVTGLVMINSVGTVRHRGLLPIQGRALRGLPGLMTSDLAGNALCQLTRRGYRRLGFKGEFTDAELQHHMALINRMDFSQHRWAAREVKCPALVISTGDDPLVEDRVPHRLVSDLGPGALRRHVHLRQGGHHAQKHHATLIADEMASLF